MLPFSVRIDSAPANLVWATSVQVIEKLAGYAILGASMPILLPGQNPDGRGGGHGGPGMLMVAGPQVKSGRIDDAHILDLAPTVLSLLGQQIPEQMEGKPLPLLK